MPYKEENTYFSAKIFGEEYYFIQTIIINNNLKI
jgi:YHS domain-containing protein